MAAGPGDSRVDVVAGKRPANQPAVAYPVDAKGTRCGWLRLFGVRSDVAQGLARQGERVRLYLPFGRDWWPYAVRRIGENPANGILLARSLFSAKTKQPAIP